MVKPKVSLVCLLVILLIPVDCAQSYTASVNPVEDVQLSFSLDGILSAVIVKEGQRVQQGDSLLSLDDRLQSLETKRRKLAWEDKSRLNTQVKTDKLLKKTFDSTQELFSKSGSVSRDEVMQQEVRYLASQGTIEQLREAEKREELEFKISETVLHQHTLRSPISATVMKIGVDRGEWVRTGAVVLRLVNVSRCEVEINIPATEISLFRASTEVVIQPVVGEPGTTRRAEIVFVSPMADEASGLVLVRAQFDNQDLAITPGSTVEVRLPGK
ncbi:efflux RND transporter periplasmic adaptor subunit [bacterium]|jgi:RND family efflux transporter MFP subunit|nr:efflux RND transporter periplasmic adaptor subunit [bacterium]